MRLGLQRVSLRILSSNTWLGVKEDEFRDGLTLTMRPLGSSRTTFIDLPRADARLFISDMQRALRDAACHERKTR
jgi:hypothetical protein